MLNPDPAKFRYLGIDLHSRTRRRVLVALTWTVLLLGIVLLNCALESQAALSGHPIIRFMILLLAVVLFGSLSVFRMVKAPFLRTRRLRGMKERVVLLTNLHDRALYKYGAPFDELPEEQQQELLRSYRVGNYYFPAAQSKALERRFDREKIGVGGQATAVALRWVGCLCFYGAVRAISPRPADVAVNFLMIGFFANYAPQSIALWNEPDLPRKDRALAEPPSMREQPSS